MTSVREGIENAILLSIGAASLTRERAEEAVAELVRAGGVRSEEGKAAVDRLMARVRGEGSPLPGILGWLEDVQLRLAELEHRIGLLEAASDAAAKPPPSQD